MLYLARPETGAVVHTHSFYSTLWSCLPHENEDDVLPAHTPYLRMKLGTVGLIPYAPPGSAALFDAFEARIARSDGYLLAHHGPVVGAGIPWTPFSFWRSWRTAPGSPGICAIPAPPVSGDGAKKRLEVISGHLFISARGTMHM
jgi:hypothetical protein